MSKEKDREVEKRDMHAIRALEPASSISPYMAVLEEYEAAFASHVEAQAVLNTSNINDQTLDDIDLIDMFNEALKRGMLNYSPSKGGRGRKEATTILTSQKLGATPEEKEPSSKWKFWKKREEPVTEHRR